MDAGGELRAQWSITDPHEIDVRQRCKDRRHSLQEKAVTFLFGHAGDAEHHVSVQRYVQTGLDLRASAAGRASLDTVVYHGELRCWNVGLDKTRAALRAHSNKVIDELGHTLIGGVLLRIGNQVGQMLRA